MTGILDPGFELTLRPMKYPAFWDAYKAAVENQWDVKKIDFTRDITDLRTKMTEGQRHLIKRLVAFFATGDSIVGNNVAISFYKHVNSPEARMYISRQIFEEALHVQFYLTLLDSYIDDPAERNEMFAAVENVPGVKMKAQFAAKHMDPMFEIDRLDTDEKKQQFLLNVLAFAGGVEGLFFYGAFAYVFYLRSRGMLPGLAMGTNWVFRDESMHMANAFHIVSIAKEEYPHLFTSEFYDRYREIIDDAVRLETAFSTDVLSGGIAGMSVKDMEQYLKHVGDQRLVAVGLRPRYQAKNPFDFLNHQDLPEMANFFERRSTSYGLGVEGGFSANADF